MKLLLLTTLCTLATGLRVIGTSIETLDQYKQKVKYLLDDTNRISPAWVAAVQDFHIPDDFKVTVGGGHYDRAAQLIFLLGELKATVTASPDALLAFQNQAEALDGGVSNFNYTYWGPASATLGVSTLSIRTAFYAARQELIRIRRSS